MTPDQEDEADVAMAILIGARLTESPYPEIYGGHCCWEMTGYPNGFGYHDNKADAARAAIDFYLRHHQTIGAPSEREPELR